MAFAFVYLREPLTREVVFKQWFFDKKSSKRAKKEVPRFQLAIAFCT